MEGSGGGKITMTTPSDREMVLTRIFDAPRELVFETHSSCTHLKQWFAPRSYVITDCEVEFKPGGSWRIAQRGDGEEDVYSGEYREILSPERIVWSFEWSGAPGHGTVDTVMLEEQDGKTTMTFAVAFRSAEDRDATVSSGGMEATLAEFWERLDEYLEVLARR